MKIEVQQCFELDIKGTRLFLNREEANQLHQLLRALLYPPIPTPAPVVPNPIDPAIKWITMASNQF